jgi:hypothetical protein
MFLALVGMLLIACVEQRAVVFRQVYSGTNGSEKIGAHYYSNPRELDNSWVKLALDEKSYDHLITGVDFSRQIIVAFSAGRIESFSGEIEIAAINQITSIKSLPIDLRVKIGVLKGKCKVGQVTIPFALAVIERPAGFQPVGGYDVQTFQKEC